MKKTYLLTPGPTQIPENILALSAKPILHHRTAEFSKVFKSVQDGLQFLYQTKEPVLVLTASGTGAMEATICNLFSDGDHVLVVNAGKFGERWTKIAKAYKLSVTEIKLSPGESVIAAAVEAKLKNDPKIKGVLFQASETSTGAMMPVREICSVVKNYPNCVSVVDAITALGVFDLPMDAYGIDVLISGSQKALMLPPGIATIALSQKAWSLTDSSALPKFYFDLKKEKKSQAGGQTAWTPAISIITGLEESLRMMKEEGLSAMFKRHEILAKATRAAVKALGLELVAKDSPTNAMTAVHVPKEISDGKQIVKVLRDQFGIVIAGGQDELEGKIFRLTHLGYVGFFDVTTGISALELTLFQLGYKKFKFGDGVGAALEVFNQKQ